MRKHRLAERLLVDVIGLPWELVHNEACRWEHVISEAVERRLVGLLKDPTEDPYGNPIPGLDELGSPARPRPAPPGMAPLDGDAGAGTTRIINRIGEPLQTDETLLAALDGAGVRPGVTVTVERTDDGVTVSAGDRPVTLSDQDASHVFASAA
jgi:DtxR family Mn-dependent transcriptional regulator